MTVDVKHFEDCEQLFLSVGKCFVVEALMEFFQMNDAKANQQQTVLIVLTSSMKPTGRCISKIFWISSLRNLFSLVEIRWWQMVFGAMVSTSSSVSTGNGEYISILRKQLLTHFFATPGFNEFAIKMLINILQCEVQSRSQSMPVRGLVVGMAPAKSNELCNFIGCREINETDIELINVTRDFCGNYAWVRG